ncbi:MAG: ABC transporter substrate-binding protein, partial [Candidatus Promineifilaceae bacterium]
MNLLGTNFRLHNRRKSAGHVAALVLTLLMAACAGGQAETPAPAETDSPPATTESQSSPETTERVATEAAMQREGTLRVAMQPIELLDPAFISSDSEVLVANHVYDYLVDIDPASNVIPRLATRWEVSDDGLSYVFDLAEGVTWHDGDPFSAADVVYTFNRLRDPELGSPTADLYANIADVQASGELQVTFSLTEPNPFFLYDLSDNHALIIKDGTEDATNFNGTGPFRVVNYLAEDRIVMEANEAYFVEGLPKLAGLEIIFFPDETAAVNALRDGQIDLSMRMSTPLFESLQEEAGIVTYEIPTNGFDLIRLRTDQPPGDDPAVIQALKLATDRQALFELTQQGHGALGNDSPIGPLYEAYHAPNVEPPAYDPEAARALLAEAGYEDGLSGLTFFVPDTGGRPDVAAVLQSQWAEAGIEMDISVVPESVYYSDAPNNWLEANLGLTGWGSRPYPQFYLDVMLVCDAIWNESHFCDPEFDALVETAGASRNEAERADAYRQIQQFLAEEGPLLIPYYFAQFAAIDAGFDGFELKAFAGRTDFRG